MVNRDWVKREREERRAVGLGARHAAKYSHGSIEALPRPGHPVHYQPGIPKGFKPLAGGKRSATSGQLRFRLGVCQPTRKEPPFAILGPTKHGDSPQGFKAKP